MANHLLLHVDEDFKIISDDLRVWTFYETIDSRLSANSGDIYFTAPLTSIKSAILGMRQERIFPLQGDHANIASFGRHNVHTLRLFLRQLAEHIEKADSNAREDARAGKWMLNLEQKVTVEVHGFFDDAGIDDGTVRAWSTRLPLREFMSKGPEACLSERLNESEGPPEESRFLAMRGRTGLVDMEGPPEVVEFPPDPMTVKNALGIDQEMVPSVDQTAALPSVLPVPPPSPMLLPVDSPIGLSRPRKSTESAPSAIRSRPAAAALSTPPSRPISLPPQQTSAFRKPSPLMRASLDQELAIDRLSPPLRGRVGRSFSRSMSLDSDIGGASSPPRYRGFPPLSARSRSTFDRALIGDENDSDDDDDDGGLEGSPKLPESVLAIRKMAKESGHRPSETVIVDDGVVVHTAFMKPEAKARKFVWIHLPFNNPTWVTVSLHFLELMLEVGECIRSD